MTEHLLIEGHKGDASLDRLLFFSDGVFAIAITLLSIELDVPDGWDGTFAMLVRESHAMLGAFMISFVVIGVLWNAHRRAFLRMVRFTQGVFMLNMVVLGGIALMPFATQLLYVRGVTGEPVLIYLSLVSMIGLAQGLAYGYAAFVADAVRPRKHWVQRLSAMSMQALMPGLCSGLTLLVIGHAPLGLVAILALVLILLIGFRIFANRRFAAGHSPDTATASA